MDFDPALLRAFLAVTEAGSFTRAAERLHLTQSAVSHQIRRLETQVGRRLLTRTTRQLRLTEDGEEFLRHARQILASLDALTQRFKPSPVAGALRFGAPENFLGERLPHLLCRFARAFPAVRLDVSVSANLDLPALIRAGDLDLAVVIALGQPGGEPAGELLRRSPLVWAAGEDFRAPASGSLPFAFFPPPCVHRQVGTAALAEAGIDGHIVFTSHSQEGIHAAVLAGLAITVMARDDLEPGMHIVDARYGLPPLPNVEFSLVRGDGGQTPAAREFGQLIREIALASPEALYPAPGAAARSGQAGAG